MLDHDDGAAARPAAAARRRGRPSTPGFCRPIALTSPLGDSTIRGAGAARALPVEGDRAGDEAAERRQVAVRRELAAGAAAAGRDQHRGWRTASSRHGVVTAPPSRPRSAAEDRAVDAGPDDVRLARRRRGPGTGQPVAEPGGAGQRSLERDLAGDRRVLGDGGGDEALRLRRRPAA